MGNDHFRPPGAPKPLNRFTRNLACVITSAVQQHIQNMVAAENGRWVGHMGEVAPSRAFLFLFFFGSFNASTAYPEKRGFSLSASKNVFRWWVCYFWVDLPRGSNFPFFCPQNHFSMGRIRLSFCIGVNWKHPLWLMIAP